MNNGITYILCFSFLVLLYNLLLAKRGLAKWDRFLLLSIPVLAYLPVGIQTLSISSDLSYQLTLPLFEVSPTTSSQSTSGTSFILPIIYLTGVLLSVSVLSYRLLRIVKLIRSSQFITQKKDIKIYHSTVNASFGRIVLIDPSATKEEQALILTHETLHIHKKHTIDRIISSLVQCFLWFNPFVYLWKKNIEVNHEYEVDEIMIRSENIEKYSSFLLQQMMKTSHPIQLSPFSQMSNFKTRIMRMYRKNSTTKKTGTILLYSMIPASLFFLSFGSYSFTFQENSPQTVETTPPDTIQVPDENPEFIGGQEALNQYFINNIRYPEEMRKNNIEERVYVGFVINKDGSVSDVQIKRGNYEQFNQEAIRVISKMPAWNPGKKDGKPVKTQLVLPIHFALS